MSLPYGLVNVPMFFFYNNILYIQYLPYLLQYLPLVGSESQHRSKYLFRIRFENADPGHLATTSSLKEKCL